MDVPFFSPEISEKAIEKVGETLRSGWRTSGPNTRAFEQEFAEASGLAYTVALNSCTAALHLSLLAHGIGPGDEVIVPTLTFAATAEVVLAVGADLVLVDSEPDSLALDFDSAQRAVTARTAALIPMHYGGTPIDPVALQAFRSNNPNVRIIGDAAHAFPAHRAGEVVGASSDGTCFSFYANKTITTGEGGMFATSDEALAAEVRSLSLHGLSRDAWRRWETRAPWDYDITRAGWKYNLTDMASALGRCQLERAGEFAKSRRRLVSHYDQEFGDIESLRLRAHRCGEGTEDPAHLYVIRVESDAGITRDDVIDDLASAGIGSSVHYRPLHMHSFYRDRFGFADDAFPVANRAFRSMVSLPLFPSMSDEQLGHVIDTVKQSLSK